MSVISEVFHDAMGPYSAFAASWSLHYAATAVRMPPSRRFPRANAS